MLFLNFELYEQEAHLFFNLMLFLYIYIYIYIYIRFILYAKNHCKEREAIISFIFEFYKSHSS